eukprot:CAMPEP_0202895082 /NCGR_PEP_ID=MMETSP1392-20130828/4362_1 /ASSEMBLY_ACC=CAM_ASM_000868 /TAXON_ID=225041 /ORGANISM="Chlamydomonas chlamydogama, Strain SAG 11-48b" /LENGTH=37 /DNA_ID= /DNA_START= /DNA_END= /DNA_ORIENTATION=
MQTEGLVEGPPASLTMTGSRVSGEVRAARSSSGTSQI